MMKKVLYLFLAALAAAACNDYSLEETSRLGTGPIYPDYMDVTVPRNIAPLNFNYTSEVSNARTTFSCEGESVTIKGNPVRWNERRWHRFLEDAGGKDITVSSNVMDSVWTFHVSDDEIDYGLTYRLLAPGYEVYSKMGIYERDLSCFRQRAILENTDFSGCLNCHSYNRCSPDNFGFHVRGQHGATVLSINGETAAYDTKTDSTLGFCVYPYWHPSGRYIAYSTNNTRQSFHVRQDKLIEVFDLASDLQIYDLEKNELISAPQVKVPGLWETFPAFSSDGRTLYFCCAQERPIPDDTQLIRYNLCKVSFDPETGTIGKDVEVVVDAESQGKSISFPKPSFDGKWLVYTLSDYGQFSIWHHEADLWMLDLRTGETKPLDAANSGDTESYHNWSSNSRWIVLSSRRDDGLYTRPYFAHVSEDGTVSKAFMLPQEDPRHFYETLYLSYNVPEFVAGPVKLDKVHARKIIDSPERVKFGFRWSD